MAKQGRPTHDPKAAQRIKAAATKLLLTKYDDNRAAMGRDLGGISGQAVGKMIQTGGASTDTAKLLAGLLRITYEELTTGKPPAGTVVVPIARYETAELAAEVARRDGLDPEAIEWVLAGNHSLKQDAEPQEWRHAIEKKERELRIERLGLAQDQGRAKKERAAAEAHIDDMTTRAKPQLRTRKK